jgi:cystathionine gamma-synthase
VADDPGSRDPLRVETRLALLGRGEQKPGQPLNVPIVPASNFHAAPAGQTAREYARDDGTPGWEALEQLLGDLEGGRAVCFSSGMAAVAAVLELLPAGAGWSCPATATAGPALCSPTAPPAVAGRWTPST